MRVSVCSKSTAVNSIRDRRQSPECDAPVTCIGPRTGRFDLHAVHPRRTDDFPTTSAAAVPADSMQRLGSLVPHPGRRIGVTDWSVDPDDWGYCCREFRRMASEGPGRACEPVRGQRLLNRWGCPRQICIQAEYIAAKTRDRARRHGNSVRITTCIRIWTGVMLKRIHLGRWLLGAAAKNSDMPRANLTDTVVSVLTFSCWGNVEERILEPLRASRAQLPVFGIKKFHRSGPRLR